MNIGLDFGGVCELRPEAWIQVIQDLKKAGHSVVLLSHAHDERDAEKRVRFAARAGIGNYTFWDEQDEHKVRQRKRDLVENWGIDLFVEDDMHRLAEIAKAGCVCIYVPQSRPDVGPQLLRGLAVGDWR